jgi:CheY-like chemotaxis protein
VNGVDLCRLLKSDPATRGVPVMLATAHAMRGDAETLLAESGADDYVSKPVVDHQAFAEQMRLRARPEAA